MIRTVLASGDRVIMPGVRASVRMNGMAEDWITALSRYAERLHATAGDRHHVASPLGAWLLLALAASAEPDGERAKGPDGEHASRSDDGLAAALGVSPARAAAVADELLASPHPLVAAATAVWHGGIDLDGLAAWRAALPGETTFGPVPSKAELDVWAREHTYGLIKSFPITPSPSLALLLASALATKVSWRDPFETVPAAALGGGWAGRLGYALRSPAHGHRAFVAATDAAGDVIVHAADAAGLQVVSVAAAPEISADRVLAAAYEIGPALVVGKPAAKSLFDLPLDGGPLWTITEERGHDRVAEHVHAVLPAWSAESTHDLTGDPGLGLPAVTRLFGELLGSASRQFDAKQVAVARYSRFGFEAAAVSAYMYPTSLPPEQLIRRAELRFGHPYAVVAVTQQPDGPWHGVPVFSAWVSEPEDVPEGELGD
jgi:hypothetical protein